MDGKCDENIIRGPFRIYRFTHSLEFVFSALILRHGRWFINFFFVFHCHQILLFSFFYIFAFLSHSHRVNAILGIFCECVCVICRRTSSGLLMDFFWAFCRFASTLRYVLLVFSSCFFLLFVPMAFGFIHRISFTLHTTQARQNVLA